MASWGVWLLVLLLAFQPETGLLSLLLICAAAALRPAPLKGATDNQRLGGAMAALLAIPLVAVLLGSESAMAFMRSTQGRVVLGVVWLASVISDIRFFRELSATRPTADASVP